MEETRNNRRRLVLIIAAIVLPALFFAYMVGMDMRIPLNDPDLWWHLKTGEYIVQNWEVPDVDPFAYTSPRPLSENQKIGLRSQWLGQVMLHLAYKTGGLPGLVLGRNLLVVLPMLILYVWLVMRRMRPWTALAVVSMPTLLFVIQMYYAFERPQGLSFLLTLLMIMALERLKRKSMEEGFDYSFVVLPLLMALWSNVHAGYIVGNIIIIIYVASEAFMLALRRVRRTGAPSARPAFFAVCLGALGASALNPNGYNIFYVYFKGLLMMFVRDLSRILAGTPGGAWVKDVVLEYKPLAFFYTNLSYDWLVFYWAFTAVLVLGIVVKYWLRRRVDLAEILTVAFAILFANMYARGIMFSLVIMPLYMAKTLLEFGELRGRLPSFSLKAVVALTLALSLSFCTYTYRTSQNIFRPGIGPIWISPWYPSGLSNFLLTHDINPPMYNYYTWGGFLIWSVYPKYKVFIDGRALDNWASRTADNMLKAYPGWENQLGAYDINFIAIPVVFRESGHIIPLAAALVGNDDWRLVYLRNNAAIFVRDTPVNFDIVRRYNIDKMQVFREIIQVENLFLMTMPYNPTFNMAKADALYALEEFGAAKEIYMRFPELSANQLQRLRSMGY